VAAVLPFESPGAEHEPEGQLLKQRRLTLGGDEGLRSLDLLTSAVSRSNKARSERRRVPCHCAKGRRLRLLHLAESTVCRRQQTNRRPGHDGFLDVNGCELVEDEDAIAQVFEDAAAGVIGQSEFFGWVVNHAKPAQPSDRCPSDQAHEPDTSSGG
jgi:hypothetical protein